MNDSVNPLDKPLKSRENVPITVPELRRFAAAVPAAEPRLWVEAARAPGGGWHVRRVTLGHAAEGFPVVIASFGAVRTREATDPKRYRTLDSAVTDLAKTGCEVTLTVTIPKED